jgi:hypothetical protein
MQMTVGTFVSNGKALCLQSRRQFLCERLEVSKSISNRRNGYDFRSVNVGLVVGKLALGQVLLRVLPFSPPVGIIPALLHNNVLSNHH